MPAEPAESPPSGPVPHRGAGRTPPAVDLGAAPPFRLDLTAWVLRRRPDNAIDRWDSSTYRRVLMTGGSPVMAAIEQTGPPRTPRLRVSIEGTRRRSVPADVVAALRHTLGTDIDLTDFHRMAGTDPHLGPLARRFRGMHPPCLPTVFEALVNAVSCQQLSLTVGIVLLNRLAARYGRHPAGTEARAFPEPGDLAGADPDAIRRLGYSHRKARTLIRLARQVADGTLDTAELATADDAGVMSRLTALGGIGRWSAEYVMLRGLGRLHVFPGDDVGARNRLAAWLAMPAPLDYDTVRHVVERWQPYAGLVYFHLLLDGLAAAGRIPDSPPGDHPSPG